jgi:nucleotide-binding universal stress UspA family protein
VSRAKESTGRKDKSESKEAIMNSSQICPVSGNERLLLAADRSIFSEGAIREAIAFAKKCSSKLYAISVLESTPEYEIGIDASDKEEAEAKEYLDSIKAKALQEGINCETIFHRGVEAYRHIVDEASKRHIDMIIIGRHGRKGLAKLLMGEDAAKVIGHAPCKVLVVPKAAKIEYKKILVATDGSKHSEEAALEAINIAKRCGSTVIAISVSPSEDELQEAKTNVARIVGMAQKESISIEALTPIGRSYDAIVEVAGGRGIDLIIMGTYGKTGLKKLLMGSVTEKVIGFAGCTVLVMKA